MVERSFDVVVIGSGFGSVFYLERLLRLDTRQALRILLIERGVAWDHARQISEGRNTPLPADQTFTARPTEAAGDKIWNFTIALGGGTNCWFGQAPRPLPSDFRMRTLFGQGEDWPLSYDDLEPWLGEAETHMSIAGDEAIALVSPRSSPFPQPPHRLSAVDEAMRRADPSTHFALPSARARIAMPHRPACCASFRCNLCPVNAKFTALNDLAHVFTDPRVTVLTETRVRRLETAGGTVERVVAERDGRVETFRADFFVLGANAVHSPAILLASGMGDDITGRYLHESSGRSIEVLLDGLDNFGGSTITTGINYALAGDAGRADRAATVLFFENRWAFGLRTERGRWRQSAPITMASEEVPMPDNRVTIDADGEPVVTYDGASRYARDGQVAALEMLPRLLAALPVEAIRDHGMRRTGSHLQGTLRMGTDPTTSVVDPDLLHHRHRNLAVVGSAVFPSCLNANPSLTVAALSLRSAARLFGDRA